MEAALIYPHQLYQDHPALASGREVFLLEDPLYFGNDRHWPTSIHAQKLVLHRASMHARAAEWQRAGHTVHYIAAEAGITIDSTAMLHRALPESPRHLHLVTPSDQILLRRVQRYARESGAELILYPSPNFLSPPDFIGKHIASGKKPFMAKFYEAQRKRMNLLLDPDGQPEGGRWSFDTDNRARLPKGHIPPREPVVRHDDFTRAAIATVARDFPDRPGTTTRFRWPVTRAAALQWLEQFFQERFAGFGPYEDAISTEHITLYHSAITPALNIGLINPQEVIEMAVLTAGQQDIPLNSLEGFLRQITGWREFMHGIYQHHGPTIRKRNFWNFDRPLPASFYTGTTGIPPVDRVIRQLLDDGWCHHIERLMILGNFMLLCRIHPDDVYRWFMEMFVDAYDWVMVPNVYGMSQFADGGTFTTKPYLSGSNYILKMSDEPKGDWCRIWDGLFWTFIADHPDFFLRNPRLAMMARTWEKLAPAKQEAHREAASLFLSSLD